MIVECPSCSTRFNLDESRIGERGAKVRCSVCSHSFVVHARITMNEVTEVDAGLDFDLSSDELSAPRRLDQTSTEPGGLAFQDNANTTPGAEILSPNDLIEIDSSEVSELDETTGGFDASAVAASNETLPGVKLPDSMPEMIDFDEVSGSGPAPSPAAARAPSADPFHDPFAAVANAAADHFGEQVSAPRAPAAARSTDFESHATAVYDVGRLAQMPEAVPDAPDLEQDVPGGLGPAEEVHAVEPQYQSHSTESNFDRPVRQGGGMARLGSFLVTATMLVAVVGGTLFVLVRGGRVDPATIGLDTVLAAPEPPLSGGYQDVYPTTMRSMLYPTRMGTSLLVVTGEVENRGAERRDELDVLAMLVDDDGEVMASGRSPIGVTLEVGELADLADRRALELLLEQKAQQGLASPVGPGAREHFMVVLPSPPDGVRDLEHRVTVVPSAFVKKTAAAQPPPATSEGDGESVESSAETRPSKKRRKKGKRAKRAARVN